MRTRRTWPRIVAATAVMGLLLTACGNGDDTSDAAPDPDDTAAGDDTTADDEAVGVSGPDGTLRFGTNFVFEDWENLDKPGENYISLVFERLVELTPDGVDLLPRLAHDWETDPEFIRFHLRDDVVFHDGTPFDADAVIANFQRIGDTPSPWIGMFEAVTDMVVEDEHTLRLDLERPAPEILQKLARRGGLIHAPSAIDAGTWATEPVGTGPWTLDEAATVADSVYVFEYFEDYYAPEDVGPDTVEVHVIQDNDARINAVATGVVDATTVSPQSRAAAEAQDLEFLSYPALRYYLLMFDREGELADANVRRAICHALDVDEIIEAQFDGDTTAAPQRFNEGQLGFNPDVTGFEHDPELAREYLEEAGNPSISLTFPSFPTQEIMVQVIQSQLAAVDIDVTVDALTVPQYFSTYQSGQYPIAYNTSGAEDSGPFDFYTSRFTAESPSNPFGVTHDELDEIVAEAVEEPDDATREALWQEFTATVEDLALACGFFDFTTPLVWAPDRVDVTPTTWFPSVIRFREAQVLDAG